MQDLLRLAEATLPELRRWREETPGSFPPELYDRVELHLKGIIASETEEQLNSSVAALTRMLVDSGPMDEAFLPSFWNLADGLQRLRKRKK